MLSYERSVHKNNQDNRVKYEIYFVFIGHHSDVFIVDFEQSLNTALVCDKEKSANFP